MNFENSSDRYGALAITLHWLTLVAIIGAYACINLTDLYPKGSFGRDGLQQWHFMLGLTVLVLVAFRLLNRLAAPAPRVTPPLPVWQERLSHIVHIALYAFMLAMPLLGWAVLSARGKAIPFFGLQLPALIAPDRSLAGQLKEIHETIGTLGYFLIGGHAAAALFHHYVMRDNTLKRMLP